MKLAIIDTLGLTYDGSTLTKRGLGGSESAVILISRELVKLGLDVTVYNDCTSDDSLPGFYDGVYYKPLKEIEHCDYYDVVISSRSVAPFAPPRTFSNLPDFTRIQQMSGHKVVWLHDTFCAGDDLIEPFILQGRINEIFTLSDWHTGYITHCDHGIRRNFDILKNHIFQTRNGIGAVPTKWVDISKKDPDLFVFNASVTKGLVPLVEKIWPKIKEQLPDAHLSVVGGYYRFREGAEPDEQEKTWRKLVKDHPEVEFTGIITQQQISELLTNASYMLYPTAFPETFGISTLEALAHNVPIITCRFGALEETALDIASYKLPYPVEKNWSLPWLNEEDQVNRFVDLTISAYTNRYLHQQKMNACNQVREICTWDTVALQWKQHLFKKTGNFLPVHEYRKVQDINTRVHEVFGRRFSNQEELYSSKLSKELPIKIHTCCYNARDYIEKCILSVAQQDYTNYKMIIVDDCSTDDTFDIASKTINSLPWWLQSKFEIQSNAENKGALQNQYNYLKWLKPDDTIIMILDGDDWLVNDPNIFNKYNSIYQTRDAMFTYGSCWSLADNIPLIAQEYPPDVKKNKSFREYKFAWNMPYTHLRTFRSLILKTLTKDELTVDGEWPKAGGDTALFYSLIEKVDSPEQILAIPDIVYNYNDLNPLNDYKINGPEQTKTAERVLNKVKIEKLIPQDGAITSAKIADGAIISPQRFSVVIPTMWRCKDLTILQLKRLIDHHLVTDIQVIDNDPDRCPHEELPESDKLVLHHMKTNIGVNPAWNLGMDYALQDRVCFANDDILFDTGIFDRLQGQLTEGCGPFGLLRSDPNLGQPPITDYSIDFKPYEEGECIHCWGQLFFFHREDWSPIPDELVINFGDDFIFYNQLEEKKNPVNLIYNMRFSSPGSQTVTDKSIDLISDEQFAREQKFYQEYVGLTYKKLQNVTLKPQKILIAIPTARYIEPDTFKSIYDLEIPDGYEVNFQYFYGYSVSQVRNLIADWVIKGYDYLFAVDHDITFSKDTLTKLLSHNKDMITGVYRQRLEPPTLELYELDGKRRTSFTLGSIPFQIGGCGFGCVLVKKEVLETVGYPQFVYHEALDHKDTFSEDMDFCKKAREKGFEVWCDPSIHCGHIGQKVFDVG